jgi:hypothetical protein
VIDNIRTDQLGQILGKSPLSQPDPAKTRTQSDPDVALQVDFAGLIERARQATEADATTVQKAQELLLSGELTSPASIRSVAESILKSGI